MCVYYFFVCSSANGLEKVMALHSSTLAWKISWAEEPDRLQSMGSRRVRHDQATSFSLSRIGEGNGNPLQCSCLENPRDGGAWWAAVYGSHRVGHDWSDLAAFLSASHPDCILSLSLASRDKHSSPLMFFTLFHVTTIKDAQGLDNALENTKEMPYFLTDQGRF